MPNNQTPIFLEEVFENGFVHTDEAATSFRFKCVDIGHLKVTDGRIIAADPLLAADQRPFTAIFPAGNFPVQLAVAGIAADERVARARIKFSETKPAYWKMALCEGEDLDMLPQDEVYGYLVDGGIGAFMDYPGAQELGRFLSEVEDNYELLLREFERYQTDSWSWNIWMRNNRNVAMFSSGWGDGFYASYIGYDAQGQICRLVTDFELMT